MIRMVFVGAVNQQKFLIKYFLECEWLTFKIGLWQIGQNIKDWNIVS